MLGHELHRTLGKEFDVYATLRQPVEAYIPYYRYDSSKVCRVANICDPIEISKVLRETSPDVVVNCVGVIKQDKLASNPIETIRINSLLPHIIKRECDSVGARFIQISTDCVFKGSTGGYVETDECDAVDLYGRSKALGEITEPSSLTIRTSIIGNEMLTRRGLIDWFLGESGKTVFGYKNAIFSGLTTIELSRVLGAIIKNHQNIGGVWHVSGDPISKYNLLVIAKKYFKWVGEIFPCDKIVCNRSLNSDRFRLETKYSPPNWDSMIQEMADRIVA